MSGKGGSDFLVSCKGLAKTSLSRFSEELSTSELSALFSAMRLCYDSWKYVSVEVSVAIMSCFLRISCLAFLQTSFVVVKEGISGCQKK